MSTLGDLTVEKIDQSGPPKTGEFVYIDISSIDNKQKRIVESKRLQASKAPSRAKQRLQPGDVLVSMTRPNLNAVAVVPPDLEEAVGSTGFHVLRAIEGIEPRWLFYAVQRRDFIEAMSMLVQGALYPAVRPKDIKAFGIDAPPLDEQQCIVAEIEKQFSRLDEAVANLKRVKANLKRYKAAVLKAAVEGKLTEEWRKQHPDVEPASDFLKRILAERRERWAGKGKYPEPAVLASRGLGPLPANWTWATVEQLSTLVQYGSSAKTSEKWDGIPVLRMGNIDNGRLVLNELKYLPKKHGEFPALLLKKGDLLFNRTNSAELVGKTAVYTGVPTPCSFASYLIRVRLSQHCAPAFLSYYINSVYGRSWIAQVVSQQVGQANVNGTKLQELVVPLPPVTEQERIVADVESCLSVVAELDRDAEANLARAEGVRQSILGKAFTCGLVQQAPGVVMRRDTGHSSDVKERI